MQTHKMQVKIEVDSYVLPVQKFYFSVKYLKLQTHAEFILIQAPQIKRHLTLYLPIKFSISSSHVSLQTIECGTW